MVSNSPTATLLLVLCRNELTSEEEQQARAAVRQGVDWELLARTAELHEVSPLVWRNLSRLEMQSQVSSSAWQALDAIARQTMLDGTLRLFQSALVVRHVQEVSLAPVVLKGFAVGQLLYSDPVLRATSDLDLLLPRADLEPAVARLESLGFIGPPASAKSYYLVHGYHLVVKGRLLGQPLAVELHWDLASRRVFPLDMEMLLTRSVPFVLNNVPTRRLSIDDTLLHLVLHIRKHRYVGLRWLCDVAELLRRYNTALDWTYIVQSADTAGIRTLLYTTASLAKAWLAAPVDLAILKQLQPSTLRRRLTRAILPADLLDVPEESDRAGWTRLAPVEVLMLDRPAAMWSEFRFRLAPPAEGMIGTAAVGMTHLQRLVLNFRRLVDRSRILLRH